MLALLWSILVYKIPQSLAESYRFRQLITLFQKVDTLKLLKIYIMFCSPAGAKYLFFGLQFMKYRNISFNFSPNFFNVPKTHSLVMEKFTATNAQVESVMKTISDNSFNRPLIVSSFLLYEKVYEPKNCSWNVVNRFSYIRKFIGTSIGVTHN